MALRIICPGFSRTGTSSLRRALTRLGMGPCYHMSEVFAHPEHVDHWLNAAHGRMPDWEIIFGGYVSTTDAPASHFWQELCERYPAAKVVLTVRDPEAWYDSMRGTIYPVVSNAERVEDPVTRASLLMVRVITFDGALGGLFEDRECAIARYEAHNACVRERVPAENLLEYEVGQGWPPLCAFLGCDAPDEPFPHANTRERFREINGLAG